MHQQDGFEYGIIVQAIQEYSPFSKDHPSYFPYVIVPYKEWNEEHIERYSTTVLSPEAGDFSYGVSGCKSVEEAIAETKAQIVKSKLEHLLNLE